MEPPTGVRAGCLILLVLIVAGVALGAVLAALSLGGDGIDLGRVDDYAPRSVVYRSTDELFVVRLADGRVIALSDVDPHNPAGRSECRVTFRPDLGAGDEPGRFFDICSGAMYELTGRTLAGDGLDLREIPLEQDEDGALRLADVD